MGKGGTFKKRKLPSSTSSKGNSGKKIKLKKTTKQTHKQVGDFINDSAEDKVEESRTSDKENPNVLDENPNEEDLEGKLEEDAEGEDITQDDPFTLQFNYELHPSLLQTISSKPPITKIQKATWEHLGNITFVSPKLDEQTKSKQSLLEKEIYAEVRGLPVVKDTFSLEELCIKQQILENVKTANVEFIGDDFTSLQKELLSLTCNYQDVYFPEESFNNNEEVRFVYCVHAINHVLKTRLKVLHHNAKLLQKNDVPEGFRDQGLVRPKVLILLPFRHAALRVVKMMISILLGGSGNVMNKKRFLEEYGSPEISMPKKNPKPPDYELLFDGNIDDNFKIGISVTKKCLKLYADFYTSDIIVASPLGLRMLIGAEGDKERDYDFLSSIEVLILDQAHVLFMQNWEHVLHVMDHLHLQPKEAHGTDLVRVRMWALNGWSKYYRQTLLFCSPALPEITALFNNKCFNYAGKVTVTNSVPSGSICKVILQIPQVFHYINSSSVLNALDARFDTFVNKIIPDYRDPSMKHTLIYVPSYFDYVRIRNYFKKQDISFVQICEYSQSGKVARARDKFFHGQAHFLLYSERFHFFRRIRVRGIHNIIFYQLPSLPVFYSEMCNMMQDMKNKEINEGQREMTVAVLYTKYDAIQLSSVVGSERATRMLASDKPVHMFMTDS